MLERGGGNAYHRNGRLEQSLPFLVFVLPDMRLPNGQQAIVPLEKLLDYCLNPEHPRGQHKARVFAAALGITLADAPELRQALLDAAASGDAIAGDQDEFGKRFVLDFEMTGPQGTVTVRSLWIICAGEAFPRLTSCYVP
jgi:hypothetical protein